MSTPTRPLKIIRSTFTRPDIQWDKCIICQENSTESLITPKESGYQSLSDNLTEYAKYDAIPSHLGFDDFHNTITQNKALYHKTCRAKFKSQKIALKEKLLSRNRIEEKACTSQEEPGFSGNTRSQQIFLQHGVENKCFLCDSLESPTENLVSVSTLNIGSKFHRHAVFLQDSKLLNKLSSTDLVAVGAKYHKSCYIKLLNQVRSLNRSQSSSENDIQIAHGLILNDLVNHIQDTFLSSVSEAPVFRLIDLIKLFNEKICDMGLQDQISVNSTRLKEKLLQLVPGLREFRSGRDVLLTLDENVRSTIEGACQYNPMDDGMCLARAADILRRHMFDEYPKFNGSFRDNFTGENCVPKELILFCQMLLGENKADCSEKNISKLIATNIAQLIRYNSKKQETRRVTSYIRRSADKETPLPVYVGLKLYNDNTSIAVIDKMNELGLSIPYRRIVQISKTVASNVCEQYKEQGFVCPPNIQNVFICAAIDNIDHNTSSNTSLDTFHGTAISLIFHPTQESPISLPEISLEMKRQNKYEISLPDSYTSITPTPKKQSNIPVQTVNYISTFNDQDMAPIKETEEWLSNVTLALRQNNTPLPWASYNCQKESTESDNQPLKCSSVILPIIPESINYFAVVRHTMDIIVTATNKINPGQIPVVTADQPVYAIAKQIQWAYPENYGEDKIVVMLGPLHIEMAIMSMIGTWLAGSGWMENLVEANITTTGRAEGLLKSAHVKKTRQAHEVTLAALNVLLEDAYNDSEEKETESYNHWLERKKIESAQFQFWYTTMDLESTLLLFVRSIRQGNFSEFLNTLRCVCPWMLSLDHVNYARWLPVFVHDLEKLPTTHPEIYEEFVKGNFTNLKTNNKFSRIGHDHLHEQNNKEMKVDSRTLCHFSDEQTLLTWSVAGPESLRMLKEYEDITFFKVKETSTAGTHHEDNMAYKTRFQKQVTDLAKVFKEHGNPFLDTELTTVNNTRVIMNDKSPQCVIAVESRGKQLYEEYANDRFVLGIKSIHSVIKRNNLKLYIDVKTPTKSKYKQTIVDLRKDSNLFCTLYVSSQGRNCDVEDFFAHENHSYAPSISEFGNLRKPTKKSDMVTCIEEKCNTDTVTVTKPEDATCLVIDGAALVHMITPKTNQTFRQYIDDVFISYIKCKLREFDRIDVVFDQYIEGSLKEHTRQERGTSFKIAVKEFQKVPKNFPKFLANENNKEQLFVLIAQRLSKINLDGKTVICTSKEKVLSSNDLEATSYSTHEEADSRLLLHTNYAARNGHSNVVVKTVDSDVVVIALYAYSRIPNLKKLWIEYGTGKNLRYLPIHDYYSLLPNKMSDFMPFFHAFTGCDTVSAFCGIGKKSAWKTWQSFRDVDDAFEEYSQGEEPCIESREFALIERFVVYMYHPTSDASKVNTARRVLFTKRNRAIEHIPPTQDALLQHLKRAILQTHTWVNCLTEVPMHLDPCNWGWQKKSGTPIMYTPLWKTMPDVSRNCTELISCKCKENCVRCRCVKNDLNCTLLCACEGTCSRTNL